jgi:hypothetical protein
MAVRSPFDQPPAVRGMAAGLGPVAMWAAYLAFARAGVKAGLAPVDFVVLSLFAHRGRASCSCGSSCATRTLGGDGWGRGAALALLAGPLFNAAWCRLYLRPTRHGVVIQPTTACAGAMLAVWALLWRATPVARPRIVVMA